MVNNFLKRFISVILTAVLCFSISVSALAETDSTGGDSNANIQTRAISGSTSATGSGYTFYVTSPGWSLFGNLRFTVISSTSNVSFAAYDPNGKRLTGIPSYVYQSVGQGQTYAINMFNAPAGDYEINFFSEDGKVAIVLASLHDGNV